MFSYPFPIDFQLLVAFADIISIMIRLILITLIVYGSTALSSNVSKTLDLLFQEIEGIAEDALKIKEIQVCICISLRYFLIYRLIFKTIFTIPNCFCCYSFIFILLSVQVSVRLYNYWVMRSAISIWKNPRLLRSCR